MIKKLLLIIFFSLSFANYVLSASSSGGDGASSQSNYDQAVKLIKAAKKLEEKGKTDKALKRYKRALKYLTKANKKKPSQPDTLNYLGYSLRKLGDYENAEKYYLLGLKIDPKHIGINEYLGELYVITKRIDLAKERLTVLEGCNCEEYEELKTLIPQN
tara:strand:+ start:2813 stop:3289 length:477 start_codon:yes stop_codon:yes gene_type:complete